MWAGWAGLMIDWLETEVVNLVIQKESGKVHVLKGLLLILSSHSTGSTQDQMAEKRGLMSYTESEPQPIVCGQLQYTYINPSNQTSRQSGLFGQQMQIPTHIQFDEIDFLSSLLTGPQAKEIIIFGEDNFTFDIALATVRNNSWDGISHGARHLLQFQKKKLQSIGHCSQMGQQQHLSEIEIMKKIEDTLRTPAPPSGVKGKVVWYQYPLRDNRPKIEEAINEMKDQQQKGDYLLFGVYSGSSTDYGIHIQVKGTQQNVVNTFPNYSFLGVDRKFVNKLVSYGYHNQSKHAFMGVAYHQSSEHQTLVFKKK